MTEEEIERIAQCEAHRAHSDAYATHEAHLMHKAHGEAHVCPHCGRSFPTQQGLAAHLRFCRRRGRIPPPLGRRAQRRRILGRKRRLSMLSMKRSLSIPLSVSAALGSFSLKS